MNRGKKMKTTTDSFETWHDGFFAVFARIAELRPDDEAILTADGEIVTYARLLRLATNVSSHLMERKISQGDRVFIRLPETSQTVAVFLGIIAAGGIAIPIIPNMDYKALLELRRRFNARAYVSEQPDQFAQNSGLESFTASELTLDTPAIAIPNTKRESYAYGVFTSGTTGPAKLCLHTHADIQVIVNGPGKAIGITPEDKCFSVSGMHLSYGIGNTILFPLSVGGALVLSGLARRPTADEALTIIKRTGANVLSGVPSYFAKLIDTPGSRELAGLRLIVSGGEILNRTLENSLHALVGNGLVNIFGTIEIGHAVVVNQAKHFVSGTTGIPVSPYRFAVVADDGELYEAGSGHQLGRNVEGSVRVLGPTITVGMRSDTREPQRRTHEWYATGDTARIDNKGNVIILGREEDIEWVDSKALYPAEVESALLEFDEVREAGIAVARSEQDGQRPTLFAFLVLRQPTTDTGQIHSKLESILKEYMLQIQIEVLKELPYISGGKLSRKTLRAMAQQESTSIKNER
jgi:acyl-coenzyme A synthetase/AMP-(fatty) acid ligase